MPNNFSNLLAFRHEYRQTYVPKKSREHFHDRKVIIQLTVLNFVEILAQLLIVFLINLFYGVISHWGQSCVDYGWVHWRLGQVFDSYSFHLRSSDGRVTSSSNTIMSFVYTYVGSMAPHIFFLTFQDFWILSILKTFTMTLCLSSYHQKQHQRRDKFTL